MRQISLPFACGILSVFLLTFTNAFRAGAQELILKTDGKSNLQIFPAEENAFVAVRTTHLENTSHAEFSLYNGAFGEMRKLNLTIPFQSALVHHAYNGYFHLFLFKSTLNDLGSSVILNKAGTITAQDNFTSKNFYEPPLVLAEKGDPTFYRLTYTAQWGGFSFSKVDSTNQPLWKKDIMHEEKSGIGSVQLLGKLLLLTTRAKVDSRKITMRLLGINRENGEIAFDQSLVDNQVVTDPTAFALAGDTLLMAGQFFTEGKMRNKACDGIFLTAISTEGKRLFQQLYDWESTISNTYRQSGINSDLRSVVCQRVVPSQGRYLILAETFDKVANGADFASNFALGMAGALAGLPMVPFVNAQLSTYRVQDMFVFAANGTGNLTSIGRVDKLPSFKAIPYDYPEMLAPHLLRSAGVFDYKFAVQPAGEACRYAFIKENVKDNPRIGVFSLVAGGELPVKSYYLSDLKVAEKVKRFDVMYGSENSVVLMYQIKKELYFKKITLTNFQ